jgi:hypothetical protein
MSPPPRYSDENKPKRDKVIRIRKYNYDRLAKLGDISWDFDDALTKVLDHWEKTTKSTTTTTTKVKDDNSSSSKVNG